MATKPRIHSITSLTKATILVDVLRLDEVHGASSGNKWFKLYFHYQEAIDQKAEAMLSFGGGFSNHLAAMAAFCKEEKMQSIGIVRGEELNEQSNETLKFCTANGMMLHFVPRSEYSLKDGGSLVKEIAIQENLYIVPEGGAGCLGTKGAGLIAAFIPKKYTHIALSVGTGTTLQGIESKIKDQQILAFAPFKNPLQVTEYLTPAPNTKLITSAHFGGFGKIPTTLIQFTNDFYKKNKIPLDLIYTAKMMAGLELEISNKRIKQNSHVLAIHTGGLQGNAAYSEQLIF